MNMSIVIIILVIIVSSVIIGYKIVRTIDEKLSSVVVNVPTNDNKLPPIYLNIDKDSNIKRVKLNDVISNSETVCEDESVFYDINTNDIIETTDPIVDQTVDDTATILTGDYDSNMAILNSNSNKYNNYDYNTIDQSPGGGYYENFGSLKENPSYYSSEKKAILSGKTTKDKITKDKNAELSNKQDPNFNLLTDIPLLVSPDIVSPNMKTHESYPYYSNKAKLVNKKDSQLVKLQDMYTKKINKNNKKTSNKNENVYINDLKREQNENFDNVNPNQSKPLPLPINSIYDGYNSHVKLQDYSYGNIKSVGKGLLTPYVDYPLPID